MLARRALSAKSSRSPRSLKTCRSASLIIAIVAAAGMAAPMSLSAPPGPGAGAGVGANVDARAGAGGELPVRAITLYRSGVGYFEHQGKVEGERTVSLRFDADKINDILKSMVVLDAGGKGVKSVSYASKEPLERRLASFGINISDNPSMADIMKRLRGEAVRLSTAEGPVDGTILGTEARSVPIGAGEDGKPVVMTDWFVNLVTSAGVKSVGISRVTSFELKDAKLADELNQALAALAEARAERSAAVDLTFSGAGERPVTIGYVHETPVWKTSYRLVLPDETGGDPTLQGWAIVENTTDQDWQDVRLSLASGNPVGFIMDLHSPLFVGRPIIPVPVMAFVGPRVYEAGRDFAKIPLGGRPAPGAMEALARREMAAGLKMQGRAVDRQGQIMSNSGVADGLASERLDEGMTADDLVRYGASGQASAGEIGEQFRYEIQAPVTIERQRSAMLPIVSAPVQGERLSIYNPNDQREHPMRGVEVKNTSAFELSPGPISVFDGGAYAGDAQIGFTSRGQSRLLSYAVDLDVRALMNAKESQDLVKVKIVDGAIEQQFKNRQMTEYTFINRDGKRGRTILVEKAKTPGWDVAKPEKMRSESETLRRFEVKVDPAKEAKLEVVEERTNFTRLAVTSIDLPTLLSFAQTGKASDAVKKAIQKAAEHQSAVNRLETRRAELDRERDEIARDQGRIRENMARISGNSDLYARYMKKMNEQESRLEGILTERDEVQKQFDQAVAARDGYLKDLDVE